MKIYKITEASEYIGVSINTLKTLANNGKIKSLKHYDVVAALKATPVMPTEFKHMSLLSGWKDDE